MRIVRSLSVYKVCVIDGIRFVLKGCEKFSGEVDTPLDYLIY
jgi:hypothetical protein